MIADKPHYTMSWVCGICGGGTPSYGTGPGMCKGCSDELLPTNYQGMSFPYDGWESMSASYRIQFLSKFSDHDIMALWGFSQAELTQWRGLKSIPQPPNFVNLLKLEKRRALRPTKDDTLMVHTVELGNPKPKKTISDESAKLMEMLFG